MQPNIEENLKSVITQAVGQASMCWQYPERAGIFQSDAGVMVADHLMKDIKDLGLLSSNSEIDRLANFIMAKFSSEIGKGNPTEGESAVDMAIRLLGALAPVVSVTSGVLP